jgi:HlyD family secretion protein
MRFIIFLLILSSVGFLSAFNVARLGARPVPISKPFVEPASSPFKVAISGAGIVEASTENVTIGTTLSGIVDKLHIKVGYRVNKGDPLFSLDTRQLQAQLDEATGLVEKSIAEVKLKNALYIESQNQYKRALSLKDKRGLSAEEVEARKYKVESSAAEYDSALAQRKSQESARNLIKTNIELSTVRAPFDGEVLQLTLRRGEFVQGEVGLVFGNTKTLHVRVDVDENDVWRLGRLDDMKNLSAYASVRGNPKLTSQLNFVRVEPYIIPKRSLTGLSTERTDTRVLQAVYKLSATTFPLYVGQQLDVFIDSYIKNQESSF